MITRLSRMTLQAGIASDNHRLMQYLHMSGLELGPPANQDDTLQAGPPAMVGIRLLHLNAL